MFVVLVVADVAIGLGYLSVGPLAGNYSFFQRLQDVVYELVGVYGPVQWASDARSDLYHLLTSALGLFTLVVTLYLLLRSAQPRPRLGPADRERIRELLDRHGDRDSLGYFALRDDKSVIWSPSGKAGVCYRVVSGRDAGLRRSARRPRGVARRHRRVPGRCGPARVASGRHGVQRARRRGVVQGGRPVRPRARRRGDRQRRRLQPVGSLHAERQADGQPGDQERLQGRGPPGRRHTEAGARPDHQRGRPLAGQPHRAGILDGARPPRRPRRRQLRAGDRGGERRAPGRAPVRALGPRRPLARPHAAGQERPGGPQRLPDRGVDQGRARARRSSACR